MKKILVSAIPLIVVSLFAETNGGACVRVPEAPKKVQCDALTKSGTKCKRKAVSGGKFCRQHHKMLEKKAKGR